MTATTTKIAKQVNQVMEDMLVDTDHKGIFLAARLLLTNKVLQLNAQYLLNQEDPMWDDTLGLYRDAMLRIEGFLTTNFPKEVCEAGYTYVKPMINLAIRLVEKEYGEAYLGEMDMVLRELAGFCNIRCYWVMEEMTDYDTAQKFILPICNAFIVAVNAELEIANAA
jgi:hypothetical protein